MTLGFGPYRWVIMGEEYQWRFIYDYYGKPGNYNSIASISFISDK